MQTNRILQVVILTMIAGVAISCTASKEYSSKLFVPRTIPIKDSQAIALKFLELDNMEKDKENFVSTDIIMGRDTAVNTVALDNLAKTLPVGTPDPANKTGKVKTDTEVTSNTIITRDSGGVAKGGNTGERRNKRTRD